MRNKMKGGKRKDKHHNNIKKEKEKIRKVKVLETNKK